MSRKTGQFRTDFPNWASFKISLQPPRSCLTVNNSKMYCKGWKMYSGIIKWIMSPKWKNMSLVVLFVFFYWTIGVGYELWLKPGNPELMILCMSKTIKIRTTRLYAGPLYIVTSQLLLVTYNLSVRASWVWASFCLELSHHYVVLPHQNTWSRAVADSKTSEYISSL